jgi:hypothetical protein
MSMENKTQHTTIAWAAGLFEGEGSIYVNVTHPPDRQNPRYTVVACMGNTDTALLSVFASLFGGRVRPKRGTALSRKPYWEWRVETAKAEVFLRAILPYLVGQKKAKAVVALQLRERQRLEGRTRTVRGTIGITSKEELQWRQDAKNRISA